MNQKSVSNPSMVTKAEGNPASPLPRAALGLGLRPCHYAYVTEHWPDVGYFEVISENYLSRAERPRTYLGQLASRYPVVLHGVSLNLLGHEPLDEAYLDEVRRIADEVNAPFVTDHLCFSGAHGQSHHDLLPTPYTEDLVDYAASRAAFVQHKLGRPFGLENLSSYVAFQSSKLTEWEFYARVVERSGTWFMLDINNVYVSSQNHRFDPHEYLARIDYRRVLQVHLAGHERLGNGAIIDTHDRAVAPEVWALYREAWRRGGPFPTLLEWDASIPSFPECLAELERAREVRA